MFPASALKNTRPFMEIFYPTLRLTAVFVSGHKRYSTLHQILIKKTSNFRLQEKTNNKPNQQHQIAQHLQQPL